MELSHNSFVNKVEVSNSVLINKKFLYLNQAVSVATRYYFLLSFNALFVAVCRSSPVESYLNWLCLVSKLY